MDMDIFDISKATKVTVSPKYQVVIPKGVREELGVKSGDQLYAYELNGSVTFKRIPTPREVREMIAALKDASGLDGRLPSDVRIKIDRSIDELLDQYKSAKMSGTPLSFNLSDAYSEYHDMILDEFEERIPGGRDWYEQHKHQAVELERKGLL